MSPFSEYDTSLTLEGIRTEVENQYLERKGRDTKATKLANELIGMLNAGGGTLAFGITDAGKIEDLSELPSPKLGDYRKISHDLICPPANIRLEDILLPGGELIFLFHVDQDYERLFQRKDNEDVFLRVADANKGPLSRDEVKLLEYNRSIRSFEDETREDFDPSDLSKAVCEEYREKMNYSGTFAELAVKRNLAKRDGDKVLYKNAALLLFANDPTQYIPNASVRYVRYKGTENKSGREFNVIKDERFETNIPKLIERLEAFINASLRDYYFLNMEVGRFERLAEFPKEAWLEGIVNALCHRSYNQQGNSIYIKHYDDRLVISNSGPLPAQVTVDNIRSERYSRNPRVARVLSEMGYVRELNEGVPRIFSAMKQTMLTEPEYTDQRNTVTLTLRNKVSDHKETIHAETFRRIESQWKDLNQNQKKLVNILFENQEATIDQMVEAIGLSPQAIRYNLKKLDDLELIEKHSEKQRDRNAKYRFKSG